jgi:dUTP pyrophosphatase
MRRFALVSGYQDRPELLPRRATAASAGYDLVAAETCVVPPGGIALVPTGVKVYLPADEVVMIHVRSSLGVKRGLMLANGTGIIDADYVDNPQNEGHIFVALYNRTAEPVTVNAGERIGQAIFLRYGLTVDDHPVQQDRQGGFGSTGT